MARFIIETVPAQPFVNKAGETIEMVTVIRGDDTDSIFREEETVEKNGPYDPTGTGYNAEFDKE